MFPILRSLPPVAVAAVTLLVLSGCEGSNLFVGSEVIPPDTISVGEDADPVLRFVEEGTLLQSPSDRLRFRWEVDRPIRYAFAADTPSQERASFERAVDRITAAGAPEFQQVLGEPEVLIRALPPAAYREQDSTRPWSFSRTFVTASVDEGITEVEILVSLELPLPVLERAALHAMGHAVGIMGHPAFPGDRTVMAARPEEGASIPTTFSSVERDAFRFLYSPGVRAGMTLVELREAWQGWAP